MFCTWDIGKIFYIFTLSIHPIQLSLSPFHALSVLHPYPSPPLILLSHLSPAPHSLAPSITNSTLHQHHPSPTSTEFFFFFFLIVIFSSTNSWPPPPSSAHPEVLSIGFFFFFLPFHVLYKFKFLDGLWVMGGWVCGWRWMAGMVLLENLVLHLIQNTQLKQQTRIYFIYER